MEEVSLTGREFPVTGNNPKSLVKGTLVKRFIHLVTG